MTSRGGKGTEVSHFLDAEIVNVALDGCCKLNQYLGFSLF